jgi:alpha-tubulin suppressor-like RCC1 family protein
VVVRQRWIAIEVSDGIGFDFRSAATLVCGITVKGEVYCWGAGRRGLGDGSLSSSSRPIAVNTPVRFRQIAVGTGHACGVSTASQVMCWGVGDLGQLGVGLLQDQLLPGPPAWGFLTSFVTTGSEFTCALADDGATYCWGNALYAQPANLMMFAWVTCRVPGGPPIRCAPAPAASVQLENGPLAWCLTDNFDMCRASFGVVSAGATHACAIVDDPPGVGAALCWGKSGPHLGGPETASQCTLPCSSPTLVGGSTAWRTEQRLYAGPIHIDISAGNLSTCALRADSLAYCWGDLVASATPTVISTSLRFRSVYVGNGHACGVTAIGQAYCWGANASGQLGVGQTVSSSAAPVAVAGDLRFAYLSAGDGITCGVSIHGVGYCWGSGTSGRLGNGSAETRFTPTRIAEP